MDFIYFNVGYHQVYKYRRLYICLLFIYNFLLHRIADARLLGSMESRALLGQQQSVKLTSFI